MTEPGILELPSPVEVNVDTPLRLADAAPIASPWGSMTASELRRESSAAAVVPIRGSLGSPAYD